MKQGEVITAEVVRVDYNFVVVVNAGLKERILHSYRRVPKTTAVKLTFNRVTFVSVAIESLENGYGDTILSVTKPRDLLLG